MRAALCIMGMTLLAGAAAGAQPASETAPLQRTEAFERGFATSLYVFDACGDPLAGRMFRRALAERVAQCPFSAKARAGYERRTALQQAKAREAMRSMIERQGGLPMRLDGMNATCHAEQASADYQALRSRLQAFDEGRVDAAAIIGKACDTEQITP